MEPIFENFNENRDLKIFLIIQCVELMTYYRLFCLPSMKD